MIQAIEQLGGFGRDVMIVGLLVFLRVGAAIAILPIVGEQSIPQRIRLVFAICFSMIIAPSILGTFPIPQLNLISIVLAGLSEVLAGLLVGISLRLFVHALQVAGSIAAQATSLSQIFGGAAAEPQPAIGHLLLVGGLAIAVSMGLHVYAIEYLILSYEILPAGRFPNGSDISTWGVSRVAHSFSLAFSLAAPFVIASLIYNIALGAINRAMPQLMVSFVGAPAITAGGLILLLLTSPLILGAWMSALFDFLNDPFVVTR